MTKSELVMKCRNLMVGDWIQIKDYVGTRQVAAVTENAAICHSNGSTGVLLVEDYEIDPIPISKEILVKNGFEWEESYYGDEFDFASLWLKEEKTYIEWKKVSGIIAIWFDYINPNDGVYADIVFHVKYVHEMQQVLRLAGLDDFANNFKI